MTKPKFRLNATFPFDKMIFLHSDSPPIRATTRPQTDGNRLEYVIYMQKWLMTFCYTEETSDFETKYYYYVAACQTGVSTSSSRAVEFSWEPILIGRHLLQKLSHSLVARVPLRVPLHINTLCDPLELPICLVAMHFLPGLLQAKNFGLLPWRHAWSRRTT